MAPRHVRVFSENNDFQHAEVLRNNRQKRLHYREFILEGVRPINLALKHGWKINSFFFAPDRGLSDWASTILQESTAKLHVELPPQLLGKLSTKMDPSELMAVVAMPDDRIERVPITKDLLLVVFDRPANPGNLGTLIRSCDALGASGLVITGHAVDLYDPETISASRGSLFALPTIRLPGPNDVVAWLGQIRETIGPLQIIASDEDSERIVWNEDFRQPTVILLGNEKWGLSAAYKQMANAIVKIPMNGAASSLNVAVAGSIILYEIERQRHC